MHGNAHLSDISSPDFSDWIVHLSETITWENISAGKHTKKEKDFEEEAQELRKEGLLCCPEDYLCEQGCHHNKKYVLSVKYPFVQNADCV